MHDLGFRFKRAHLKAVAFGKKKLRKWELSPARFDILYVVQQGRSYGVLQSRIWDTLGLHKSTISKMCKRLEELGFITRVDAADNGSDRKRGMRGNGWVTDGPSRRNEEDDYDEYDDHGRKQGRRELLVRFTLQGIIAFKKAMRLVFESRGWRFAYRVLLSGIMPAADDVDAFIARMRRELERVARAFHDTSHLLYPLDSRPGDVMVEKIKKRLDLIETVRKNEAERDAKDAENKASGPIAQHRAKVDEEQAEWEAKAYVIQARNTLIEARDEAARAKLDARALIEGPPREEEAAWFAHDDEIDLEPYGGATDPDDDSYDH